jgi:hypothetical protein
MRIMLLAAVLVIAACDSQPPKTAADIDQIIRVADEAMHVTQIISAGAPAADVHAAMEQMSVALNATHKQIDTVARRISIGKYRGIGSIHPVDLSACIYSLVHDLPVLERMPIEIRGPWLMHTLECRSRAAAYFDTVSGEEAAAVALAISVIEPIMMVAEAQFGLGAESALESYRSSSQAIMEKLISKCGARKDEHRAITEQMSAECAAYEVARAIAPKLAKFAAELPKSVNVR